MPVIYKWLNFAHRVLFPPRCVLCEAPGFDGQDICAGCLDDLPLVDASCRRCALPLPAANGVSLCGSCLDNPPAFDRTLALCTYAPPVDFMIQQLKFSGELHFAPVLGGLLANQFATCMAPDTVLPVPLHLSRLRERGFNQAVELARPLARGLRVPLDTRSCRRTRATAAQSGMSRTGRQTNIRQAFEIVRPFRASRVALIDDVMTTGSTVNELARVLKRNGAQEVTVVVVARAVW